MLDGLYSAAAGMAAQQQRLDAVSNDVANAGTAGYQSEQVGFEDLLYSPAGYVSGSGVTTGAGSGVVAMGQSQLQGALQKTGRSLDVALNGPGFLEVQSNGQMALTRNGALALDASGQITTASGDLLQPPIKVPTGVNENDLSIGSDGTVRAAGKAIGKLALVTVPAPEQLTAAGNSLYMANAASGGIRAVTGAGTSTTVTQGALEGSNVNVNTDMVNMLDAQRTYSLDSQAIHIQEQMMSTADAVKR